MARAPKSAGFLLSAFVHAGIFAACLLLGILPSGGCRTRQETLEIPFGFEVEGPEEEEVADAAPPAEEEPAPESEPEPEPEPDPVPLPPEPKPEPKPEKKKHVVQISKKRVTVGQDAPKPVHKPKTPSAADIGKALGTNRPRGPVGDPNGSRTAARNDDNLAAARIISTLKRAWNRPTYEDRGSNLVVLQLTFRPGGSFSSQVVQSSGSAAMDNSVLNAARGVGAFRDLPAGFIDRNPSINVEFELEPPR